MSATCVFLLKNLSSQKELKEQLEKYISKKGYNINFNPQKCFIKLNEPYINNKDFLFEPCDDKKTQDSSLLLSYEDYYINGVQARHSLKERLSIIEGLAKICLEHTDNVEIFLSDDNPCLSDYITYYTSCVNVTNILYAEYNKDACSPFLPCIRLILGGQGDGLRKTGDGSPS